MEQDSLHVPVMEKVAYIGEEFDVWEDISADCMNTFILCDLVKILLKVPDTMAWSADYVCG